MGCAAPEEEEEDQVLIPAVESTLPLVQWLPGVFRQGLIRLGREYLYVPSYSNYVKNINNCTSTGSRSH